MPMTCIPCFVCLLALAGIIAAPLLWLNPLARPLEAWSWHPAQPTPWAGAFVASSVTVKETVLNERTRTAEWSCVFLARDFRSSPEGWALALHRRAPVGQGRDVAFTSLVWTSTGPRHRDDSATRLPPSLCRASPQHDCQRGTPRLPQLMAERLRNATAALRALRARTQPQLAPPGYMIWVTLDEVLLLDDGWELQVLASVSPPLPIRLRIWDRSLQWELFFVPELVRDLPLDGDDGPPRESGGEIVVEEFEAAPLSDPSLRDASGSKQTPALCQWASLVTIEDNQHDDGKKQQEEEEEEEEEGEELQEPVGSATRRESRRGRRSRRQTEVVVVNRRKKHSGGNGAAVAIGLGVGLGVGIPVVVLLALVPLAIALWFLHRRRRRDRTIRVADVPTGPGVFATGAPRTNPTYPPPGEEEDYSQGDLQSALGDNY